MTFTNKELKAIFTIAKKHQMVLRLCQSPWVFFTTKEHQKIAMRIRDVMDEYESDRKREKRESRYQASVTVRPGLSR